jgi:hypothetical protein
LVVATGTLAKPRLWTLEVARDAASALQEVVQRFEDELSTRTRRGYDPDATLGPDEVMEIPPTAIRDHAVVRALRSAAQARPESARTLRGVPILYYAIVTGDALDDVSVFVRKYNPARGLRPGGVLLALGETLERVSDPVVNLDSRLDLVLAPDEWILTTSITAFQQVFRETTAVLEHVTAWVGDFASRVPFANDGAALLVRRCQTDGRVRAKVLAIQERGHLAGRTIDDVRAAIRKLRLPEDDYLGSDGLRFDPAAPFLLLRLLNEDTFRGAITDVVFDVDAKSAATGDR